MELLGCQDFITLVDCWAAMVLSCWWTMGLSGFCRTGGLLGCLDFITGGLWGVRVCHTGGLWGCQGFVILVDCWAVISVRVLSYWRTVGLSLVSGFCHTGGLWGSRLGCHMPAMR